ncbi:MAG: hypothetical protein Q4C10_11260 [Clostridia bacterium]|nr:hypothetical protein [Clostridia bacterium]
MSELLKAVLMAEAVGLCFSAMIACGVISKRRKRKKCTAQAIGEITEILHEYGARNSYHHLRVRFDAGSFHMNAVEPCDCPPRAFSVGEKVEVCYDPADPQNFYVLANDRNSLNDSLFIAVAIGIPILMLFIALKVARGM